MEGTRRAVAASQHIYSIVWHALEAYWYVIAICSGLAIAYLLVRVFAPHKWLLFKVLEFAAYVSIPVLFLLQADFGGGGNLQEYHLRYTGHCHLTVVGVLLATAVVLSVTKLLTPLIVVWRGKHSEGKQRD